LQHHARPPRRAPGNRAGDAGGAAGAVIALFYRPVGMKISIK
jgi:hypothetical protein